MAWRMSARKRSLSICVRPTPTTAKGSGSTRPWNIDQSAGTSLRRVRSPEAPKITRQQDSSPAALTMSIRPSQTPCGAARDLQELLQSLAGLAGETHPDDPPAALAQRFQIPEGLRGLEEREAIVRAGDGEILLVLAHDLDEDPVRPTALVQLPGGVQILRPEGHGRGDAQSVAHEHAQGL